jgi:hypothetical protein
VNILDENVFEGQRLLLRMWRIPVRHIGHDLGRKGMTDHEIIPLLHHLRKPTFFTRDSAFYVRKLRHENYCLVWLDVEPLRTAEFVRRVLRHRECDTQAKRMGKVIGVSPTRLSVWRWRAAEVTLLTWRD